MSLPGCARHVVSCDQHDVAHKLVERTGHDLGELGALPPGACLEDGLAEDEAVTIALWCNAAFHEMLVDLELTRADLIQAKLLPNPELWYLSPVDVKQLEYAIEFPIEVLWLRPLRIASARFENERTCEQVVQGGLNLIRDTRQAYAELLLSQGRLRVYQEGAHLRSRIAQLAEARLKAGDASPSEAAAARIDALQAEQDLLRIREDVTLAEQRLRNLLGVGMDGQPLVLNGPIRYAGEALDVEMLASEALQNRPDAVAASHAVLAAEERVQLSRRSWFRLLGIIDANGRGLKGHEIGPGFRVTIPIFNQGQGGVARAQAELARAERHWATLQQQILLEVHRAFTQHEQARLELDYLEQKVRPEVEAAIRRADRAYKEGNTSYLLVLEATRQLLDSHLRAAQLQADWHRAWAELERSVGRRLTPLCMEPILPEPALIDPPPDGKEPTP